MANALSIWVVFFCVLLQQARSQSCGAGSTDCKCIWTDPTTNQPVIFDLSGAFTYPLILNSVLPTSDYQYYFSPCAAIDCGATSISSSNVCQENSARTVQYNAGASPKWAVTSSTTATITYSATTGATTRTTTVTVVLSKSATNNSASLVTEGVAKYSFTVTLAINPCTPDPTFGGCICRGAGFVLDISKTFKYPYTIKSLGGYEYTYSPCTPIVCGTSLSSVCQKDALTGMEYNCGVTATWEVTSILPLNFIVIYTVPGSPRTTTVTIIQTPSVLSPTTSLVVTTALNSTYVFTIYLPLGGSSSGGESGDTSGYVGFILISIIIAALIAYFVIGALIMYQFKGARGSEIIPNIGFWKDLPFLIKDGVVFAFSPCCGQRFSYTKM